MTRYTVFQDGVFLLTAWAATRADARREAREIVAQRRAAYPATRASRFTVRYRAGFA